MLTPFKENTQLTSINQYCLERASELLEGKPYTDFSLLDQSLAGSGLAIGTPKMRVPLTDTVAFDIDWDNNEPSGTLLDFKGIATYDYGWSVILDKNSLPVLDVLVGYMAYNGFHWIGLDTDPDYGAFEAANYNQSVWTRLRFYPNKPGEDAAPEFVTKIPNCQADHETLREQVEDAMTLQEVKITLFKKVADFMAKQNRYKVFDAVWNHDWRITMDQTTALYYDSEKMHAVDFYKDGLVLCDDGLPIAVGVDALLQA